MSDSEKQASDLPKKIEIKARLQMSRIIPSHYAHHMAVQHGADEVVLSFYESVPPILPPDISDAEIKQLQEEGVPSECVARITVSKKRFLDFAKLMHDLSRQMQPSEGEM